MELANGIALHSVKDRIAYNDEGGNFMFDFEALVVYTFGNNLVEEIHKCEIINVSGFSSMALRINSKSDALNDDTVYREFSSAFGEMTFDESNGILLIKEENSEKIGPYQIKIILKTAR